MKLSEHALAFGESCGMKREREAGVQGQRRKVWDVGGRDEEEEFNVRRWVGGRGGPQRM